MKQHIVSNQADQLGEKGKKRYLKYCQSKNMGVITLLPNEIMISKEGYQIGRYMVPLLSIGQMIEFLDEEAEINEVFFHRTDPYWKIALTNRSIGKKSAIGHKWFGPEVEFCDALWQATKEKLNLPLDKS